MTTSVVSNGHQSTARDESDSSTPQSKARLECQFCQGPFPTRNALFRHLRTSADCFQKASQISGNHFHNHVSLPKQKVGIRFGYHLTCTSTTTPLGLVNERAALLVQRAFLDSLRTHQPMREEGKDAPLTQASAAKMRRPCLAQDRDCSASSDFIGFHFQGEDVTPLASILGEIQQRLDDRVIGSDGDPVLAKIQILDARILPLSSQFQAEQSCTQRVYHYLLPLDWLEGGQEALEWWKNQIAAEQRVCHTGGKQHPPHQPRTGYQRRPEVFKRLKRALHALESRNLSTAAAAEDDDGAKILQNGRNIASPGRVGSLWVKERRCWHNFADPSLGGNASPSNDPVWRGVDRAKVVEVTAVDDDDRLVAVVEIRGDGFVTQQIRRMMGAVVAMTNGWLPVEEFVAVATRSDICIETPLAPAGRQYFLGGRFHFVELLLGKKPAAALFHENTEGAIQWETELRRRLFQQAKDPATQQAELAWLEELKQTVVPRIQLQLSKIASTDMEREQRAKQPMEARVGYPDPVYTQPPSPYGETVSLLRSIVEQGKWPKTSKARSRVIRSANGVESEEPQQLSGKTASSFDGERFQSGSFTVVNPDLYTGNIPLANELFPDLAKAVFQLEAELAKLSPGVAEGTHRANWGMRPPSTHCAVNSRAEFVPHVDSGRGMGQSVSMIVGLGDYSDGGAIFVEGQGYDIRYRPIEFDGWKQRHWTEPFTGERFSLVWFTPASTEDHDTPTANGGSDRTQEDERAERLVVEHQSKLSSFPKLKYRDSSTDSLAINEIFDIERGCAYELKNHVWNKGNAPEDFSLSGHKSVLDIGAHIGTFSRFALAAGCTKVIAFEPEPNNLELLKYNLKHLDERTSHQEVVIHDAAVSAGESGFRQLVYARSRGDGTVNTWRHSLENYSQYVDRATNMLSANQEAILTRTSVLTVPFFGGALVPGVTFVKLDCEGAEVDILLSESAASSDSWLDVSHLVFEWSFTKEKRVFIFRQAIDNLEAAGFQVVYDGQGAWWDTGEGKDIMWPFRTDLVVFAKRR